MKRLLILCLVFSMLAAVCATATVVTHCSDGKDNDGDGAIDLADGDCVDANDNSESPLEITTEIVCGYPTVPTCTQVEFKKLIKICNTGEQTVTGIIFKETLPHEVINPDEPVFEYPIGKYRATVGFLHGEPAPDDQPDKGSSKLTWYGSGTWPNVEGFSLEPGKCASLYLWLKTRDHCGAPAATNCAAITNLTKCADYYEISAGVKYNCQKKKVGGVDVCRAGPQCQCQYFWSSTGTVPLETSLNLFWSQGNEEYGVDTNTYVTVADKNNYTGPAPVSCGCTGIQKPHVAFVGSPVLTPVDDGFDVTVNYKSAHPNHKPSQGISELLDNFMYISKPGGAWQNVGYTSLGEEPTCGEWPGTPSFEDWFASCTATKQVTFHTSMSPPFNILDIKLDECLGAADPTVNYPGCEEIGNCDTTEVPGGGVPEFSTLGVILVLVVIAVLYPVMKSKVDAKKNK